MPIQSVGFTNVGPLTSQFDLAAEQAKLLRQRQLANTLLQSSMEKTSPLVDAGKFKVANWGDAVGRVADAYASAKMNKTADDRESGLAGIIAQRRGAANNQYNDLMTGKPGVAQSTEIDDEGNPYQISGQAGAPPNAQGAAMALINSGIPDLMDVGKKMKEQLDKGILTPKDMIALVERHSGTMQGAQDAVLPGGGVDFSKMKPTGTVAEVGGNIVDTTPVTQQTGGLPKPTGYYGLHYSPIQPAQPNLPPTQTALESNKSEGVTGGAQMPDTIFDQEFSKTVGPEMAKDILSRRNTLQAGVQGLPAALALMNLPTEAYTGAPWAGQQLWAQKAAQALGLASDDPRVQKTEVLRSMLNQKVAGAVKQFTSRLSNQELTFLTKAQGTDLSNDPETTKTLTAMYVAHLANEQQAQDQAMEKLRGHPVSYETSKMLNLTGSQRINPETLSPEFGLVKDPGTDQWTTTRVPSSITGNTSDNAPKAAPMAPPSAEARAAAAAELARRKALAGTR